MMGLIDEIRPSIPTMLAASRSSPNTHSDLPAWSEIFYVSEAQRDEALRTIDDVNASGLWPGRVVTKVSPAGEFWEAEPEHQDYLERYPLGYTCHFPRPGWKLPRRAGAAA
jgi:peptide-methionine (S)-S-oxide reductase